MATKLTTSNFSSATVALLTGATVTGVTVTDNTYTAINATAVSLSGGYIKIIGTNFVSGASVYLDSTTATSVAFVSSTQLNVVVPPLSTGTYILYVINGDGTIAIRVPGLTYSSVPSWNTSNTLNLDNGVISYQLSATSDSTIIYALYNGTTLPTGLTLSSTGLISGTLNPNDTTVYNFTVIATDTETQTSIQSFAVTITVGDEYFKFTSLLLNAQGPDRAELTPWIKDASTNNLAITSVGDAKASAITPFSTNWSNYFDGASSSGFRTLTNSNLNIASDGNVTIEFWLNTNVNSNNGLFGATDEAAWGATSWSFIYSSSAISLHNGNNGGSLWTIATPTLHDNQWHHLAIVRSSGTWQVFTDGVSRGTTTTQGTRTLGVASWRFAVGCIEPSLTDLKYTGSISNFRLTKSAVYTSNFTPSTTALTAITNTFLLTCQSNGIVDNSSQRLLFTTVSTTSPIVQYSNPFGTSLTGGSGYFDGTGDSLTAPQGSAFQFPGDFTIECWVYATNSTGGSSYDGIVDTRSGNVASSNSAGVNYKPDGYLNMYVGGTNTASSTLLGSKRWVHIALVRSGSAVTLYQNGVAVATATSTANLSDGYFTIGGFVSAGYWNGYISNVRVVKGVAVYTSAFSSAATAFPNSGTDDSYFNNTVLLLHGDGTNLANNNTFLDSSTNNFSITRNGNTTQGTFTPFSQTGWSNYFSGGYLRTTSSTAAGFSTNPFTVEAWVYMLDRSAQYYLFGGSGVSMQVSIKTDGTMVLGVPGVGDITASTGTVPLNAWTHIAYVRSSTSTNGFAYYINGVASGTATLATDLGTASATVEVGTTNTGVGVTSWTGYISNIRVVKGTAVYTGAFTPSTIPLTAITNTSLLTCQSNRFVDNSSANASFTLSVASVQAFSPFLPTTTYNTSTVGGSGYFDGTGDYLTVADNAAFTLGTNDFTLEFWVYPLAGGGTSGNPIIFEHGQAGDWGSWIFQWLSKTTLYFYAASSAGAGSYNVCNQSMGTLVANQWTHVVVTRSGSTFTGYKNGVVVFTSTSALGLQDQSSPVTIGRHYNSTSEDLQGYVAGARIVNGTAIYTAAFTPPTAPPTAVSNTQLLLNFTNAGIIDSASKNDLETVGTAKISTVQSKYGSSSIAFDGSTSSWLFIPHNRTLDLSTGAPDWTLECWGYVVSFANSPYFFNKGGVAAAYYTNYSFSMNSSGTVFCTLGNNSAETSYSFGTCVTNTWYHFAATRSGSTIRTFLNGILVTTQTIATVMTDNGEGLYVGCLKNLTSNVLNGYVDDLRITRGVARYTTSGYFIPPTSLLASTQSAYTSGNTTGTAVTGTATSLLTLQNAQPTQNSSFTDGSQNNFAITRNGNTTQGTFTPFSQTGWSNFFNGSSYLTVNNAATQLALGTVDWQIELWCYPTSLPGSGDNLLYDGRPGNGAYPMFSVRGVSAASPQKVIYYTNTAVQITSDSTVPINAWTHIMLSRVSSVTRMFINGVVQSQTYADTTNYLNDSTHPQIGRNSPSNVEFWNGYITNVRVLKGSGTSTSFTPSTAPLNAITNTVLLTCQSNRLVDNSANNFSITDTGSGSVQAFSPFAPAVITPTTYSNYFDGTGDYLTAPNAAWMNLGTGDFTMECWIQINTVTLTQMFVSSNYNAGTGAGGWAFLYRQDNTTLVFTCNSNVAYGKTWSPVVGTMYHVAVCRSGTDLRLFVNGTQIGTTSTSSDNIAGSSLLFVGSNATAAYPINGVISNLRIVTSALYTANFTPSTSPLTAITNTQLLTCQSSTFVDNSTNAATFTAYGNVKPVTSPVPFAPVVTNTPYSTSLIGGSAYFDGTGDYLTLPANAAFNFNTGNFTLETWIYMPSFSTFQEIFSQGSGNFQGIGIYTTTSGKVHLDLGNGSSWYANAETTNSLKLNSWNHVAIVRQSTTYTIYLNGASDATTTTATFPSNASGASSYIAVYGPLTSQLFTGYLSGFRIVKGTGGAIYTSNFAPPVAPPTNITNTSLLTNFTNGAIFDNTAKNVLETVGNAQISTTQSKYGGTSMYFSGSGNYLTTPYSPNLVFRTGDFTFECWLYWTGGANENNVIMNNASGGFNLKLQASTAANWALENSYVGQVADFGTAPTKNTWHHIAVTRASGTLRAFINGVQVYSGANSTDFTNTAAWAIGGNLAGNSYYMTGFLDDLRITRGIARYTSTFQVPTQVPVR